jgi:S1-C subfamily serine protease
VESVEDLLTILDHHKVGETVTVEFLRDGRRQKAAVTLQPMEMD